MVLSWRGEKTGKRIRGRKKAVMENHGKDQQADSQGTGKRQIITTGNWGRCGYFRRFGSEKRCGTGKQS